MDSYQLARLKADQPILWAPLVLPACLAACKAAPGTTSTFELSTFKSDEQDPLIESFSLVHATELSAAETATLDALEKLPDSSRDDLLHIAAVGVIAAVLRTKDDLRVLRISKRGPWLDFHLQGADEEETGVLVAFGSSGEDLAGTLADVEKHVNGAKGGRKIAGAVAFGGRKAALRILS